MPHLMKALSERDGNDIAAITQKILEWRQLSDDHRKIVSNLYFEHFAPVDVLQKFLNDILEFINDPIDDFTSKVYSVYSDYTFSGGEASLQVTVSNMGFALTRGLCKVIIDREYLNDYFASDKKKVEEYLNLKSTGQSVPDFDHLPIKGPDSTIWVTWSEESDDPFDFLEYNNRAEIYNALALSKRYLEGPVFLFRTDRTKVTSGSVMTRPTVFDAGNYAPFQPVEASYSNHGYTNPHNFASLVINNVPLVQKRRPEIILKGDRVSWGDINRITEL